ncbi:MULTISPECIES: hydrolase [unclassified Microbacterium]|uniref:hydrolase n=1 Tax=unclassified Microbacterium TaxID=2609290 RepID=UPI0012FB2C03|nr:hydrolase [Microbacterium sp. MAH-37]MVQ40692.1 hydrolase [Microbacterium sp. MAH-37]
MIHAVRYHREGGTHEGALIADGDGVRLLATLAPVGAPRLEGIVTGRFTDHHVHLQLVDPALLTGSRLGRVVDLGADLEAIRALSAQVDPALSGIPAPAKAVPAIATDAGGIPARIRTLGGVADDPDRPVPADADFSVAAPRRTGCCVIDFAGPFLTAPGGYPSDRDWAPDGAVVELRDAAHAAAVVDDLAAAGASALKAVAHSEAGPVLDDDLMRALADLAAGRGFPLIVHAEGAGQAQRAARLGATALAHAPFSEPLDDDEIAFQAASVAWISTIAVHDDAHRAIAIDNVRRFAAAGGMLLYGTDMGNGPTPVDLNTAELAALREAGVEGPSLLRALAPLDPLLPGAVLLVAPETDLASARLLTRADLQSDITAPAPL